MSDVPFIKLLRKGGQLSSRDFNALTKAVKKKRAAIGGYFGEKPEPCMFYTAEAIPPYSIFPLAGWMANRVTTLETCFLVEKYNESEGIYYDGYFGTNGAMPIPAESAFIGHVIEHSHDYPVTVHGYSVSGGIECGFLDGSWEATQESKGLYITGKCPFGEDIYFVRISEADCCDELLSDKFVCLDDELTEGGSTTAKEWQTDEEITVYASPLLCEEETIPACSMVQASWFPQYQKWYVVAIGGTCHCECEPSTPPDSTPPDSTPPSTPPDSTPPDTSYPESDYHMYIYWKHSSREDSRYPYDIEMLEMDCIVTFQGLGIPETWTQYHDYGACNDYNSGYAFMQNYVENNQQEFIDFGASKITHGILRVGQGITSGGATTWYLTHSYDMPQNY